MAISHVKSNTIADFTGTVTVFNSLGATQTANATDLVRPSDWNSVHNQYYTLTGNTNNASTASGTNVVLSGGNGVTLVGSNSVVGISVATNYQSQGAYLTTARASNDAVGLNTALTAGPMALTVNSSGLSLNAASAAGTTSGFTGGASISGSMTHNTAGLAISMSHPAWITTAMQSNAATISNINVSAGTTSQNLSAIVFSNSNGVSFGLNGSTITGSVAAPGAVTLTNYATGNTTQSSSGTIAGSSVILRGSGGVSAGISNGSYIVEGPALTSLSATGALSASSNGSTISLGVGTVTVSATSNTVTDVNSSGTVNLNALIFKGVGNASVGLSNGSIVISASGGTGGGGGVGMGVSTMGNTTGTTGTVTTGNVALVGSGVISLSQSSSGSNATISILAPATSSLSATGAVSISANGSTISIGVGQVTASAVGNTTQTSSGGLSLHSLHLSGAGNVSVGYSAGSVIISGGTAAAAPVNFSAGTTSNNLGSVVFADSNGVSFGLNGSTITASYTRPVVSNAIQPVGSATGSGTNTSRFAADDHVHEGVFSMGVTNAGNGVGDTRVGPGRFVLQGGNNVTLSQITAANALNTIVISGGAAGAADGVNALVVNGGASTATTTLTLSNSNNVSFGHNAGVITASASFSQTNQTLSLAATSNTAGNTSGMSVDARSITLAGYGIASVGYSTSAGGSSIIVSASQTVQTQASGNIARTGVTTGATAGSQLAATLDTAGLSLGVPAWITTQSAQAFSADASSTFQTLTLQNSNGVSFSNNAGAVRITHDLQYTSATSAITSNALHSSASRVINIVAATNNTGGGTASLSSNVSFTNANGATFYTSAGGAVALSYSVPAGGGAAISAGANSQNTGTVNFANSNGITFGLSNNGTMTASHNGLTTARASNDAIGLNTAQTNVTWTVNSSGLSLNAAGYAGTGTSITGGASMTLNSNGLAFNGTALAGTGTTFAGANISASITMNTAGINLSASVAAPGAAAENNNINLLGANTAGNTTASGSTIGLSGINMTLSGTNNSQVVLSVPATSSLVGASGVSISTNGSTITIYQKAASGFNPYADIEKQAGQYGQATLQFDPVRAPNFVMDRIVLPIINTNSSNSSGSHTLSFWVGLYSKNASTLSLVQSVSSSTALTHSGTAGSYSLYSGNRLFTIPLTTTITEGDYWLGFVSRTTSGGANGSYSNLVASNIASNFLGFFGSSHNTTQQLTLGQGVYTASTSGMPSSVAFSDIRGSDSQARRAAFIMFAYSTV